MGMIHQVNIKKQDISPKCSSHTYTGTSFVSYFGALIMSHLKNPNPTYLYLLLSFVSVYLCKPRFGP